jgi:hypothetical protein
METALQKNQARQKDKSSDEYEVLHNKEGTFILKLGDGSFQIQFSIENKNILLNSVLNFDLIKLVYDLNKDICEKAELQKLDDSYAIMTLLIKNFFEDLGISQKFSCLQIHRQVVSAQEIIFLFSTFTNYKPSWLPSDLELAYIDNISLKCICKNPHQVDFDCFIQFPNNQNSPAFVQKMSVMIVHKIINRLKQFIENVKIYI